MSTCAACGHEAGPGRFCTSCGSPLATAGEAPTHTALRPVVHGDAPPAPSPPAGVFMPPPAPEPYTSGPPHPRGGGVPRWLPWLLGWLLLAVVAAMVGWALGSDDTDDTDDTPDPSPSSTAAPTPRESGGDGGPTGTSEPEEVSDVTAGATAEAPATAPPNEDVDGNPVTYDAVHMLDGDPSTAWRMPGDGTGAVLRFTLPAPTRLTSVGLVNGYAKVDGDIDWYPRNRRVTAVTWAFDDGSTLRQDLIEGPSMQTVAADVVTTTVTLTLEEVSAPGGSGGRDFTPVSDVRLIGAAAAP